jgi:hypothetical protein
MPERPARRSNSTVASPPAAGQRAWRQAIRAIDGASAFTWAELHSSERANRAQAPARARAPRRGRARRRPLETARGQHRKRLGVPRQGIRRRRRLPRRPATLHPRRATELQRLRRARPAHHPRRMLAPSVRSLVVPTSTALAQTSGITSTSTTTTAPTPDASPKDVCPQTLSTAPTTSPP